jgi:hypothetical protein
MHRLMRWPAAVWVVHCRAGSYADRPVQWPVTVWWMFRSLSSRMIEERACLSV